MMTLTRKSDYALLALVHLYREGNRVCSAREIADAYEVPVPILMNILKRLCRAGMVASTRGARGGYRLALEARDITLYMVISAIEGPVGLFQCARRNGQVLASNCGRQPVCPMSSPARRVSERLRALLEEFTLEQMADEVAELRGNDGDEPEPAGVSRVSGS